MKKWLKFLPVALMLLAGNVHAQQSRVLTASVPTAGVVYMDTCAYTNSAQELLGSELTVRGSDSTGTVTYLYGRIWGGVTVNLPGRVLYDTSAVNGLFNFTPIPPPLDSTMVASSYSVTKTVAGILLGTPTAGQFGWIAIRGLVNVRMAAPASGVAYVAGTEVCGGASAGLAVASGQTVGAFNGQNTRVNLPYGAGFGKITKTATADSTLVNVRINCQ